MLPSTSAVLHAEAGRGDAEVEGDRALADAALRREHPMSRLGPRSVDARRPCCTPVIAGHQVVAVERHRQDLVDPLVRVDADRVLGHRQDDDRHADLLVVELLDELHAAQPALEEGVDDDHVGSVLGDLAHVERDDDRHRHERGDE